MPVGEYAVRFGIGCSPDQVPIVERAIDEIIAALQSKGPTPGELEKVTRTWLNEFSVRTTTNDYWSDRLRTRALDPELDDEGPDYVDRVKALTAADVQELSLRRANAVKPRASMRAARIACGWCSPLTTRRRGANGISGAVPSVAAKTERAAAGMWVA